MYSVLRQRLSQIKPHRINSRKGKGGKSLGLAAKFVYTAPAALAGNLSSFLNSIMWMPTTGITDWAFDAKVVKVSPLISNHNENQYNQH